MSKLDQGRLRHALRASLATVVALVVAHQVELPGDTWMPITTAVLMAGEPRVGGVLNKSSTRLLGTVLGALVPLLMLALLGSHPWSNLAIIAGAVLAFAYVGAGGPSQAQVGALGAVTTVLVLTHPESSWETAGSRMLAVLAGGLWAMLASRLILPDRAEPHLRRTIARIQAELARLYRTQVAEPGGATDPGLGVHTGAVEAAKLMGEARAETPGFDATVYGRVLRSQRRLSRYLGVLIPSVAAVREGPSPPHELVLEALDALAAGQPVDLGPLRAAYAGWSPGGDQPGARAFQYTLGLFIDELEQLEEALPAINPMRN